jgi:hypothetical protein
MRFLAALLLLIPFLSLAQQETFISGKIQDKRNKEALPFVSVGFKGTRVGTTTDFEGNFKLKTTEAVDSIVVSYVGYKKYTRSIKRGQSQNLLIELSESSSELKEVVIKPGVNPALRIVNNARKFRDKNDVGNLSSYQYDSYNKVDISINNISEEIKNKAAFKPLKSLFDTANQMKNEEGKYILPMFISETFSQYFFNKEPSKNKELVLASTSTGIGIGDKSFITDLMGASLLQINFNGNFVRLLAKDFISPLSNVAHTYYIFTLLDSVDIDHKKCYKLKLNLRREQDLGFLGHMWIEDSTWAIKRIDVEISKSANINFIDRLKIQQEFVQTRDGPFIAYKNRFVADIAQITEKSAGMIAKIYNSYSNIKVNEPKPSSFFDVQIEQVANVENNDTAYWASKRPEAFTGIEKQMFTMVDSIRNLPVIQTYIDVVRIVVEGYKRIGGLDWGPYVFLYGYNNYEGNRIRLGFKTNHFFSKRWILKSYLAYGFRDERLKYALGADYITNRKKWSVLSGQFKYDYDVIGVTNDFGSGNNNSNLFQAIAIFGNGMRFNSTHETKISYFTNPKRDWSFRFNMQHNTFEPLGDFVFAYKDEKGEVFDRFSNTQASAEARWAYKEEMVLRGNGRLRMKRSRLPELTLTYTHGFKGILNSNFDYNKLQLGIIQHANTGVLGTGDMWITAGKIWGRLPYPLLDVARGNQTFLYSDLNYSLLNFYEFVSDEYVHFTYVQHFEGLFFNRIPIVKNWKLRNFAFVKSAYGSMSDEDKQILPANNLMGKPLTQVNHFKEGIPYVEVGYGIENIFKLLSINMVHRLTYLDKMPGMAEKPRDWGINLGLRFQF